MMRIPVLIIFLVYGFIAESAADLRLTGLKAVFRPDSRIVDLHLDLENHGPAKAENAGCNVNVFAGDRLIISQTFSLEPLEAGELRKDALPITVPGDRVTRIQAEIYDTKEPDVQPSTNFMQINIQPPGLKKADLKITEATVETPEDPRHKTGVLRILLQNNGPEKVSGTTLQADLDVFSEVAASSEHRIRPLDPGATYELKIPVPTPPVMDSTEGTVRLKWILADAKFTDPDQDNNSYQLLVPLQIRMPDLVVEEIEIRKDEISIVIRNQGNVRAGESVTALYVNNALAMRYETPEIPPGRTRSFRFKDLPISPDTKVAAVADFNAQVEESSEENNRSQFQNE